MEPTDLKGRARRLAAQLMIADQLGERSGSGGSHGVLKSTISAAAGNAYTLARLLSVTEEEIQAEAESLRSHGAYQNTALT